MKLEVVLLPFAISASVLSPLEASAADDQGGTLGPWRVGDMAYSTTPSDDRPNAESQRIVARDYTAMIPEKLFTGEKGKLGFRVAPRTEGWAGIIVVDAGGKAVALDRKAPTTVSFTNAQTGQSDPAHAWLQFDQQVLFTDASRVFPKTRLTVSRGKDVVDEATIDLSQWKLEDSRVRMSSLLDGPTSRHGFVTARDGAFWRDGERMFFWGGHENHVPSKEIADLYAETYSDAGLNVQRSIGFEEMIRDPATGEVDMAELDKYHYLVARLGEKGIYFVLSCYPGYLRGHWGYERGKEPADFKDSRGSHHFWVDPQTRELWKRAMRTVLTTTNPYTGRALKDDPTLICVELANETGLNERRFDYNRVHTPEETGRWRRSFNEFLLRKYGSRERLAEAWKTHPLFPHEDPARGTILIPTNFRGPRNPYGGTGQHDQFTTGRWYRGGLPADKNPRLLDAIEFNRKVAHKDYPFDFNNLTTPRETEALRIAFNRFLLDKYHDYDGVSKAWEEDPLLPGESPDEHGFDWKTKKPDPNLPGRTILIPSNYRGEGSYRYEPQRRQADPRVSDAIEFTYEVQRVWATDLARFLKDDVGVKCGVGWNGDTFHMVHPPNHKANTDSPLDIAIAAAYLDSENGDQLTSRTKNLKRFNTYGRIFGRPMFSYEWSFWSNQGLFVYEYCLLAGIMGRQYGFDGYAHHKMAPQKYPVSDPAYSLKVHWITPLTDRPRRGAFYLSQWIMQRSKIKEDDQRILIGMPDHDAFIGGPERRMSNWAFENWIMYQLGIEDYSFKDVYDGPKDRIVIHDGRGPYGDYRQAKHAILWCHANTNRDGSDPEARKKWFRMHGIEFRPGQKYFLNDQFFATTEDMTDYNVVHRAADAARLKEYTENLARARQDATDPRTAVATAARRYWDAEPNFRPTDLDRQLYRALKRWGYPLPFEEDEIDQVWRSRDKSMEMDTRREQFAADRDDFQMWFGRAGEGKTVKLSRLEARTDERQYAVALVPWDTADLRTARTLALWSMWNGEVTVRVPEAAQAKVYAVNWLGKRIFQVRPTRVDADAISFATARHDDVFCYEIGK